MNSVWQFNWFSKSFVIEKANIYKSVDDYAKLHGVTKVISGTFEHLEECADPATIIIVPQVNWM